MLVKVYLTSFGDRSALDEKNMLELDEGATLGEALKKVRIPLLVSRLGMVTVNQKRAKPSDVLQDGDSITFIGYVVGG
jgi:molybdopterin converting factor small subunit